MNNTITLNKIISIFRDLSIRHEMINDFGFGQTSNISASRPLLFPYLWVEPTTSRVVQGSTANRYQELFYSFNIYVMDKIQKGDDNFNDTLSDTNYISSTIIREMSQHPYYVDMNISLAGDISMEPAIEETDDNVNGWLISLTLKVPVRYGYCETPIIPISGWTSSLTPNITQYRLIGDTGPQGPIGPAGVNGNTGPQGINGVDGSTGPQGPIGFQGLIGNTGPQGINGVDGSTGPQGPIGFQGFIGSTGPQGLIGLTGAQGPTGPVNILTLINVVGTSSRVDNWSPSGYTSSTSVISVTVSNSLNAFIIGGLTGGTTGRIVTLKNNTTDSLLIIENESASSTAANRINMNERSAIFLMPSRYLTLFYDGTTWTQFNETTNLGGFGYFEDFANLNPTNTYSTQIQTNLSFGIATGGGFRSESTTDEFGNLVMNTLTANNSDLKIGMGYRDGGNYFPSTLTGRAAVTVNKIRITNLPTATQDYFATFGFTNPLITNSFNQQGYSWRINSTTVPTTFWQTVNVSGGATTITAQDSTLTLSTSTVWLGIFLTGVNGDATYFYSTNGSEYVIDNKFTRTVNSYGGAPAYSMRKIAGTTASQINVDWNGFSFINKR